MRAAKSFTEVLSLRGRIVLFSPSAAIAVRFETVAEWNHARIVHTRGIEDSYVPLSEWQRVWNSGEYAVLSCDQHRYINGVRIQATDIVWVGETGHHLHTPHIWSRFSRAMSWAERHDEPDAHPVRLWLVDEGAL